MLNRKNLLCSVVLMFIIGCASTQPNLTPCQRLFAMVSEYEVLQSIAVDYCESQTAIHDIKQAIKKIDGEATPLIMKIRFGAISVIEAIPQIESAITQMQSVLNNIEVEII